MGVGKVGTGAGKGEKWVVARFRGMGVLFMYERVFCGEGGVRDLVGCAVLSGGWRIWNLFFFFSFGMLCWKGGVVVWAFWVAGWFVRGLGVSFFLFRFALSTVSSPPRTCLVVHHS